MTAQMESRAIAFLKEEFNPDLDYQLKEEAVFDSHPLLGNIHVELFSFEVEGDLFFIFVGETVPMIYPAMDLTTDELWAAHIGTEYFLQQGVTEDTDRGSTQAFFTYLKMVSTVFQEQLYISKPDGIKIQKVFVCNGQKHVVGSAEFGEKKYSWIVGDITHFVYKKSLPPQVTWALHMGRILLT